MSATPITLEELEAEQAELFPTRDTQHCCPPRGRDFGVAIVVGTFVI